MPTTSLRTPADIVAAAAGLLGFAPTNSIVAYMLNRHPAAGLAVRCAIRFDVTVNTGQAANLPATCHLRPADNHAAILLAVCDQRHDIHALAILDTVRDAFEAAGIPVMRRVMARDVTAAGRWIDPDSGEYGPTYPYTDSIVTAERVGQGERVSPTRADIVAEFDPIQPAPPVALGNHAQLVATTTQEIAAALAGDTDTSPTLPTRAGLAITTDVAVRDEMIGLAVDHARAGADLWTRIGRQLRGQPRAEALTVAAVCFCLLGDAVRAGIATDAALEEAATTHTPVPRLAALLASALQSGMSPQQINRAIVSRAPKPDQD
jgi:hypothetical protein